jgi:lysophospholipase L1-like esterase
MTRNCDQIRVRYGRNLACFAVLAAALAVPLLAQERPSSTSAAPVLKRGDRVAIVGDSITEQKLYSRYMEDYLLACVPQLELAVVQLGWSGERADGFAARLENDLLPLRPNVVTTCYGMNDGLYRPYEASIGEKYAASTRAAVQRLKAAGATVVVGSPGAVDTDTFHFRELSPVVYNENLAHLRDIARDVARSEGVPFANVHDPLIAAMAGAKPVLGATYHVCGPDGFHPAPNGHLVMAYAFLKALGLDGQIGTLTVDAGGTGAWTVKASDGHRVVSVADGDVELESTRYPFCFFGEEKSPDGTRSILPYVPFNAELNRFVLVVRGWPQAGANVTWGPSTKHFTREQLAAGVNLAAEFPETPFANAFRKLDEAVAQKQVFETRMIKEGLTWFRSIRALLDNDADAEAALTSLRARLLDRHAKLQAEVRAAVVPVRHHLVLRAD